MKSMLKRAVIVAAVALNLATIVDTALAYQEPINEPKIPQGNRK
jgi:hypothetical protein